MEPKQLKQLTQSVQQVTKDFDEVKNAGELARQRFEAAKKELETRADKLGKDLEELQGKQSKLEAAMNRPGVAAAEDEKKAQNAIESRMEYRPGPFRYRSPLSNNSRSSS